MPRNLTDEIFRHIRPQWFNEKRLVIENLPTGGISFLFLPSNNDQQLNYWIYSCPNIAIFSNKAAVNKLRQAVDKDVKPWGTINMDGSPLIDLVTKSVLSEDSGLPTTIAKQLLDILIKNFSAKHLYNLYLENSASTRNYYES